MSESANESDPQYPRVYTYRDIARMYRDQYRDNFQRIVFARDEAEQDQGAWKRRRVILSCDENERVHGAIIVVDYNGKSFNGGGEDSEVLAANTVDVVEGAGKWLGTISLNRSLYLTTDGPFTHEHLRYRKAVIAHEWLEVMYAICNGRRNQSRAIGGDVQLATLLAELNFGLPMEDRQEHWDDLVIGLREVLVSRGTLVEKLFKMGFENPEDFRRQFQSEASEAWLMKHADAIGNEIYVDPKLIKERLLELIREPRTGR